MSELYYFGKDIRDYLSGFLRKEDKGTCDTASYVQPEYEASKLQEPILDVSEVQGNILAGFNKNYQTLMFFEIVDSREAKRWLYQLQPWISTLEEVISFNRLYKLICKRKGAHTKTVQATWVNIAFSFEGLKKLDNNADMFSDSAFKAGIHNRSALLGDPIDKNAEGNCNNWLIGGPNCVADIILIIASDSEVKLADTVTEIEATLTTGLRSMFRQQGTALPLPRTAHEHFGFSDAISQPGVRGRVSEHPTDFLTSRENPKNLTQGKPGQDLLWPGEFVFGCPRQDPNDSLKPGQIAEAGPSWARNGSFLVFRRLRQDVEGFRSFTRSVVAELSKRYPEFSAITPEEIGAKLMGRWQSGTPIVLSPKTDNAAIAEDESINNNFGFKQDVLGLICPHAAHIRKAYPRDDLDTQGTAAVQTHRLLRRGIPFGAPYPAPGERGLLFLAYQTSFERQFEFITHSWMNNPNFRDSNDGYDPIVGQNNNAGENRARTFVLPVQKSDGTIEKISIDLPNDWVIPTGGGYFFAPSISALKYLASN